MTMGNLVAVVDDDESVREALPPLLNVHGFDAVAFASAEEYLSSDSLDRTSCLVLDVAMPGITGPELQQILKRRRIRIPIIFITGRSGPDICPELIARGAAMCLSKPLSETEIVRTVREAVRAGQEGR